MSELSDDAASMHSSLKMLFGKRGVNKSAGRTNKEVILSSLMGVASRFTTDCGVRYRTGANNGKWIILDEFEVRKCLEGKKATGDHATNCRKLMNDSESWPSTLVETSMPFAVWVLLLDSFHALSSKENTHSVVQSSLTDIETSIVKFQSLPAKKRLATFFDRVHQFAKGEDKNALAQLKERGLNKLSKADIERATAQLDRMLAGALTKVKKDLELFKSYAQYVDSNEKLIWTNRRMVTSF